MLTELIYDFYRICRYKRVWNFDELISGFYRHKRVWKAGKINLTLQDSHQVKYKGVSVLGIIFYTILLLVLILITLGMAKIFS